MSAEIVVYGGTAGGVAAAVAAARMGSAVVLLEPGRHVGGMVSGGLGYTDPGDVRVLGGLAREFRLAVADYYGVAPGRYAGPAPGAAESILAGWLEGAGVDVRLDSRLASAETAHGVIGAVMTDRGERFAAAVFVDASYEGDLLAAAGVPSRVGREDPSLYGESLAGRREFAPGKHQFPTNVSPYDGDHLSPLVHARPLAESGTGDGGVMAYGYRACLSQASDRIPFERREGYDPSRWELARRYLAICPDTIRAGDVVGLVRNLPDGKCDANSIGPLSLNVLDGSNWAYPDADPPTRERIRQHHEDHTRDFLHFMSTDPEVPRSVRDELSQWGFPADEFVDTGGLPHQLYVREARRMLGEHVLTQHDLLGGAACDDAIAMGSYHIDIREVQRTWAIAYEHPDPVPWVFNEGYLSVAVPPYPIPYRSIVPRAGDCANLLVPVCVSASHVAFASVRMEVQYQMLGHAAGLAAHLASALDTTVHQVPVPKLRDLLLTQGAVLGL